MKARGYTLAFFTKKIRQIGVSKECAQNVNKLHKMCLQSSKNKICQKFCKKKVLKSAEFAARESHANPSLWWRPLLCCWPPSLTIVLIVIIVITIVIFNVITIFIMAQRLIPTVPKFPTWWESVHDDDGGNLSVTKSHH